MDTLAILQRLGSGQFLDDLGAALIVTAEEVVASGKPGVVSIKFQLSNKSPGDVLLIIDEEIARRSPKRDPKGAIFYSVDGGLHREDPRQTKMEFRTVDTNTGEIRDVPTEKFERSVT